LAAALGSHAVEVKKPEITWQACMAMWRTDGSTVYTKDPGTGKISLSEQYRMLPIAFPSGGDAFDRDAVSWRDQTPEAFVDFSYKTVPAFGDKLNNAFRIKHSEIRACQQLKNEQKGGNCGSGTYYCSMNGGDSGSGSKGAEMTLTVTDGMSIPEGFGALNSAVRFQPLFVTPYSSEGDLQEPGFICSQEKFVYTDISGHSWECRHEMAYYYLPFIVLIFVVIIFVLFWVLSSRNAGTKRWTRADHFDDVETVENDHRSRPRYSESVHSKQQPPGRSSSDADGEGGGIRRRLGTRRVVRGDVNVNDSAADSGESVLSRSTGDSAAALLIVKQRRSIGEISWRFGTATRQVVGFLICFFMCCMAKAPIGVWPTLEPLLGEEHVLGSTKGYATESLNNVQILAFSIISLLSIPYGVFYDVFGPALTGAVGTIIAAVGLYGMGVSIANQELNWLLFWTYPVATAGGAMNSYAILGWLWIYPKQQNLITGLIGVIYAASDGVAIIAVWLTEAGYVKNISTFFIYLGHISLVTGVVLYFLPPGYRENQIHYQLHVGPNPIMDDQSKRSSKDSEFSHDSTHEAPPSYEETPPDAGSENLIVRVYRQQQQQQERQQRLDSESPNPATETEGTTAEAAQEGDPRGIGAATPPSYEAIIWGDVPASQCEKIGARLRKACDDTIRFTKSTYKVCIELYPKHCLVFLVLVWMLYLNMFFPANLGYSYYLQLFQRQFVEDGVKKYAPDHPPTGSTLSGIVAEARRRSMEYAVSLVNSTCLLYATVGSLVAFLVAVLMDKVGLVRFVKYYICVQAAYALLIWSPSYAAQMFCIFNASISTGMMFMLVFRFTLHYAPYETFGTFSGWVLTLMALPQLLFTRWIQIAMVELFPASRYGSPGWYQFLFVTFGILATLSGLVMLMIWGKEPPPEAGSVVLVPGAGLSGDVEHVGETDSSNDSEDEGEDAGGVVAPNPQDS